MTAESRRDKFLLEFYEVCWKNITRAEESAWKMFAAYTAVFAGSAFASEIIGITGFLIVIIVFSFLAIALSLNANLWFTRNMGLISNLEREFLHNTDYGVLVPKSFKKKIPFFSFKVFEAWWVLILAYFTICLSLVILLFPAISNCSQQIVVIGFFAACFLATAVYGILLAWRHHKFRERAPGVEPKDKPVHQ